MLGRGHKDGWLWIFGWATLRHKAGQGESSCKQNRAGPKGWAAVSLEVEPLRQAGEINKDLEKVNVLHPMWPRGQEACRWDPVK